jgi:hypothetical protein
MVSMPVAVEVSKAERQPLSQAQTRGVERHPNGAMLEVSEGLKEALDLLRTQHHGEFFGLFGEGDVIDRPGFAQTDSVEEAQTLWLTCDQEAFREWVR